MKKRIVVLMLTGMVFMAGFNSPVWKPIKAESLQVAEDNVKEELQKACEAQEVPQLQDLPKREREIIDAAISAAEESGEMAGRALNNLSESSEAIGVGVKEVLDIYYGAESVDNEAVEAFREALEEDIGNEVQDYEKAREERGKQPPIRNGNIPIMVAG